MSDESVPPAGGREACPPGAPSADQETTSATYQADGQHSSLTSSPPDGSALTEPAPKLSPPGDGAEAESGVGSQGVAGAPSRPLHENINQQVSRHERMSNAAPQGTAVEVGCPATHRRSAYCVGMVSRNTSAEIYCPATHLCELFAPHFCVTMYIVSHFICKY